MIYTGTAYGTHTVLVRYDKLYIPANKSQVSKVHHTIYIISSTTVYLVVQTFKRGGTLRRVSFSLVYATVACVSNLFKSIQVFFVRHAREIEEGGHLLAGRVQRDRGRRRGVQDSHPAPPPDTSWTRCELTCTLNG